MRGIRGVGPTTRTHAVVFVTESQAVATLMTPVGALVGRTAATRRSNLRRIDLDLPALAFDIGRR